MKKLLPALIALFVLTVPAWAVDVKFYNGETKSFKEVKRDGDFFVCTAEDGRSRTFRWSQLADEEIQKHFPEKWPEVEPQRKAEKEAREADAAKEAAKKAEEERKAELERQRAAAQQNPMNPGGLQQPAPVPANQLFDTCAKAIQARFQQAPALAAQFVRAEVSKGFVEVVLVPNVRPQNANEIKAITDAACDAVVQVLTSNGYNPRANTYKASVSVWAMLRAQGATPEHSQTVILGRTLMDTWGVKKFDTVSEIFGTGLPPGHPPIPPGAQPQVQPRQPVQQPKAPVQPPHGRGRQVEEEE